MIALKNGQSTMAAFNAVAGLNPFTIIAGRIAAVVGALVFLQVKFNIFGQAWNAIVVWGAQQLAGSAECSGYWSGC